MDDDTEHEIKSTATLFAAHAKPVKSKVTERGELLKYFASKIDKKIPYVAFKVMKIPTKDLYFIKSTCDDYERRGNPWAKGFYGSLKVVPI